MVYFVIHPGTDHLDLDPTTRRGSVVFSAQNKTGVSRRVRALVTVPEPAQQGWYTVKEPLQHARVDENLLFPVDVTVPPDVAPGSYGFGLRVVAEDDPDDVYEDSQQLTFDVQPGRKKGPPWWIFAVVAALIVVGVLAWLIFGRSGVQNTAPPAISGTAEVPAELTATEGTWEDAEALAFAFRWQRCDSAGGGCTDIGGATSSTYVTGEDDVDSTLRVVVTASRGRGSASATSEPFGPIAALAPVNTAPPTITGTPQVQEEITADEGTWENVEEFAFQWQRCHPPGEPCFDVGGATARTYPLGNSDEGETLRVAVTGILQDRSATATSEPFGPIEDIPPDLVPVPSVVTMPLSGAVAALKDAFQVVAVPTTDTINSCDPPITGQSPAANTQLERGSQVTVVHRQGLPWHQCMTLPWIEEWNRVIEQPFIWRTPSFPVPLPDD